MKKQNNRPDSSYKNSTQRSHVQQRVRPSSVSGKTEDGLTNLFTIDVPEMDLSPIKESRKPHVSSTVSNSLSASKQDASKKQHSGSSRSAVSAVSTKRNKSTTQSRVVRSEPKTSSDNQNNKSKSADKNAAVTNVSKPRSQKVSAKRTTRKTKVKIIPLGGLNEIGKNLTVIECSNDIIILDSGIAFPDSEMLGIDLVIPDYNYLEKNAEKIRGIVITHGHEDHIGGLPYMLRKVNAPVYATRLTIGLIEGKLKEHGLTGTKLINVTPGETVKFGCMAVEFIRVNHSIPDAVGMAFHTPAGIIVHTGDFKVDFTPIDDGVIDLARFAELGNKGVLALMADSTNAERPGYTMSERLVGESFEKLFATAESRRIIIATFASNIHRVQQIINIAERQNRKVAVSGRSMVNVIGKSVELGYLKCPNGILIDIDEIKNYDPERLVIITTGSQGEPMSALTRMSRNEHRQVNINPNDFIIISATPIPGNEKLVTNVVNELMKSGADVVYEKMYDVHVSGHACQEEQKLILSLTKPKFFIPVHGEYKHLAKHAETARKIGIDENNIIIASIGDVIETDGVDMRVNGAVQAGKVLVDGLGVGDVGSIVLRDRRLLAQDGLLIAIATVNSRNKEIISGPDVVSRGFVYVRESEELMEDARKLLYSTLRRCFDQDIVEWSAIKIRMKDVLTNFIYQKTKRSPMILPVIMEA